MDCEDRLIKDWKELTLIIIAITLSMSIVSAQSNYNNYIIEDDCKNGENINNKVTESDNINIIDEMKDTRNYIYNKEYKHNYLYSYHY